jgi:hypothetical protein
MKETAMGEGWWCGLHYGNLNAVADAPEGRALADEDTAHE